MNGGRSAGAESSEQSSFVLTQAPPQLCHIMYSTSLIPGLPHGLGMRLDVKLVQCAKIAWREEYGNE